MSAPPGIPGFPGRRDGAGLLTAFLHSFLPHAEPRVTRFRGLAPKCGFSSWNQGAGHGAIPGGQNPVPIVPEGERREKGQRPRHGKARLARAALSPGRCWGQLGATGVPA